MPSLLRIPVADVLLLEPSGESPDVRAAGDTVTPLQVLHGEERVMFHAHVVETKVHRAAIRRGRQHRLGHDAWDVQLSLDAPSKLLGLIVPACLLLFFYSEIFKVP